MVSGVRVDGQWSQLWAPQVPPLCPQPHLFPAPTSDPGNPSARTHGDPFQPRGPLLRLRHLLVTSCKWGN